MVDEEAALLSGGDQVAVRSERAEDFPGGLIIGLLPFGDIPGQFEQRRGRDGRCRGVARFVGDPRGVVIPVGHEVRGQAGMADEVFGALHGAVQVTFVARFAVAHRETVETPALAPRPGRRGRMALPALLSSDAARPGVVADDVERTVVGAEVVFEGVVGMAHGDVVVAFVARESRGREQHFEVHHVVDDHPVGVRVAALVVPRADQPDGGAEAGEQGVGGVDQQLLVVIVSGQAVSEVTGTAHHESQVVGFGVVAQRVERRRAAAGHVEPFRVAGVFVEQPDVGGEKSADPSPRRVGLDRTVRIPRGGEKVRGGQQRVQQGGLSLGAGEGFADDGLCGAVAGGCKQAEGQCESKHAFHGFWGWFCQCKGIPAGVKPPARQS